jgi:rRNA pseudouridine-1189 N-methylase Emg1 (Nep1/Mra1 family)
MIIITITVCNGKYTLNTCVSCGLKLDKIVLQNAVELIKLIKNDLLNIRNEGSWALLQEKGRVLHIKITFY